MKTHKYLDKCGFNVFEFGVHKDGTIDVSNGNCEDMAVGVTQAHLVQIQAYMANLEARVKDYIELHYWE